MLTLFVVCGIAMSFKGSEVERGVLPDGTEYEYRAGRYYAYTFALDTITDAANDTLYLPSRMSDLHSNFQGCVSVTRTNISGTTNIAVKVEETAYDYSGSTAPTEGWASALKVGGTAAATAATTATIENLNIPESYGMAWRIVVDGTGTQSSSYKIRVVLKQLNGD